MISQRDTRRRFVFFKFFGTKPQQQASTWTDTWIWFKASGGNRSQSGTQTEEQITTHTLQSIQKYGLQNAGSMQINADKGDKKYKMRC